jgi:hypothetical protein
MPVVKLKITCRIAEVPAIGGFLIDSLTTDQADFLAFSPDFDADYLTNASAQLEAVDALINPKQYTAELKVITERMYANMNSLRGMIDFLEGYIDRATGLTMAPADFGISAVRKANNRRDVEGLLGALKYLMTNVGNNLAALTAKGFTKAQNDAITAVQTELNTDNTAQNAKENARNANVVANYDVINDFWATLVDISKTGARIYKTTQPNKVGEYTIASLIRRIRQEQKKDKFVGVVTSGGSPVKDAKVELVPLPNGRRRTTSTNEQGEFVISSLSAGNFMATVSVNGDNFLPSVMITIVTGQTTTQNFAK